MKFEFDSLSLQKAKLKVVGVGGAGGNAVTRMITTGMQGVDFIAINTDAQDLDNNPSEHKIQVGKNLTKGLGAGANSSVGRDAVEADGEVPAGVPVEERAPRGEKTIYIETREKVPREFYISERDAIKHGITRGCGGCSSWYVGKSRQPHNEACRERFKELMKNDAKFIFAEKRKQEFRESFKRNQ